jgi:hypothetical protein
MFQVPLDGAVMVPEPVMVTQNVVFFSVVSDPCPLTMGMLSVWSMLIPASVSSPDSSAARRRVMSSLIPAALSIPPRRSDMALHDG